MTTPSIETNNASLARDALYAGRYYLGSGRGLLILAAIAVAGGLVLNWSWLVAAGIAPILIAVLPCAIMCGLGLCMNRLFGNSCDSKSPQLQSRDEATGNASASPKIVATSNGSPDPLSSCCHETAPVGAAADLNKSQPSNERRSSDA